MRRDGLHIATRGSPLALAQTEEARRRIAELRPELAEQRRLTVSVIKTSGDRVLDRTLAEVGGKGLFTKEIDEAMLAGAADLAVHSVKDLPTVLPDGIVLACVLPRADPRDAFVCRIAHTLSALPPHAVVGTASLRRQAQVRMLRPDLAVEPIRGNVETRLRKLRDGEADATMLAYSGLRRLEMAHVATCVMEPDEMLPSEVETVEHPQEAAEELVLQAALGGGLSQPQDDVTAR